MARQLKVYTGMGFIGRAQRRCVIAAPSKAEVRRIVGVSRRELDDYWCETGNPEQRAAALAKPLTLLIERGKSEYVPKDDWHL